MIDLPKTWGEAKAIGAKFYFTGKPCARGHIDKRRISGTCVTCRDEKNKEWYLRKKKQDPEHGKRRYQQNKVYHAKYNKKNKEYHKEYNRKWYLRNKDYYNEYYKNYAKENPEKYKINNAKRRASKLQRAPAWLTDTQLKEIRRFYTTCPEGYEVDHIYPLQGKTVSGLHVPWNLQHLTAEENRVKSNKLIGEY